MINQNVVLPYTPRRTTQQDIQALQQCLRGQRSTAYLRSFDVLYVPVWLGDNLGPHTITVTLNNDPRPEIFDYVPGPQFFARQLSKTRLLQDIVKSPIQVPHSISLTSDSNPTEEAFGPYLAIKTMAPGTARGVGVYVLKTRDFASLQDHLLNRYRRDISAGFPPVLQQYIPTGSKPQHTRVSTFLGAPIVCFTTTAPNHFDPESLSGIVAGDATSNFSSDRTRSLTNDEEFVDIAQKVADIFPETSVLSIDMVRCAETGKTYCLEVNLGNLSVLSAPICNGLRRDLGEESVHKQFGSYHAMAKKIVEKLDLTEPH